MARLVHFTSSLKRGGAEAILSSLVQGLQHSFNQTILYIHDGPHRHTIERLGVNCIQVQGVVSTYDPLFLMRLYKIVCTLKPDVLHTLLWAATVSGRIVGRMLNIPVVSVYHGNVDQDGGLRNRLDRLTMPLSTVNCAVSSGVAQSIKTLSPNTSVSVIHNGIDCAQYKSTKKRADVGLPDDHFVIGAVGRFVGIKRFDLLIDALALLHKKDNSVRLCLIGTGPELNALRERARQQNVQNAVVFLVDVPAVDYYHLFDCFVLPSPREGISIALLEAMRAQLPSIVVSDSGHPVVRHERNGLVVPRADAQLLAHAIERVKTLPDSAHTLGVAARATVVKFFNRNAMITHYYQMFHTAIHR